MQAACCSGMYAFMDTLQAANAAAPSRTAAEESQGAADDHVAAAAAARHPVPLTLQRAGAHGLANGAAAAHASRLEQAGGAAAHTCSNPRGEGDGAEAADTAIGQIGA